MVFAHKKNSDVLHKGRSWRHSAAVLMADGPRPDDADEGLKRGSKDLLNDPNRHRR